MSLNTRQQLSLEEISRLGERFYNEKLRGKLEKENVGEYVVIDVERGKHYIDADRLIAVEKAREESGDKLFYIIQIGSIQNQGMNYTVQKYAWNI